MGLSDRDYMNPDAAARNRRAPRAPNRAAWWPRFKFWLWRIFKGK